MNKLTRYVLLEVVKVFLVTLIGMTLLMIIIGVVREARSQGLGPAQIVQLIPYILPDALRMTVPGTILFATCIVYGRMSSDNEVVAVKSLGINPWWMLAPTLVIATLLSLGTVILNDLAVSWGRNGARAVVIEAVGEIAYGMLRTHKSYSTNEFSINVKRVDDQRLIQPTLSFHPSDGTPAITVRAAEAELRVEKREQEKVLVILCRDGTVDVGGRGSVEFRDTIEREIPLEDASRSKGGTTVPSWLALRVIPQEIEDQVAEIDRIEEELAAKAGFQMLLADFGELADAEWTSEYRQLNYRRERLHRLRLEPQRRWANGFSCLCFVLIGAPMAIRLRHANPWSTFFICFLPILGVYYPFLASAVDMGKSGRWPPEAIWGGNLALSMWGLLLMRKVLRY